MNTSCSSSTTEDGGELWQNAAAVPGNDYLTNELRAPRIQGVFAGNPAGMKSMSHPKATTSVLLVLIFVLFSSAMGFSQTSGIKISGGSHISVDHAKNPHVEPFLAVNPKDPKHWLATAIVNENGGTSCYPYVSRDGGRTWKRGQMKTKSGERIFGTGEDPLIYFDPDGNTAFFGTMSAFPRHYLISRSTDGGLTWEDPVSVPSGTIDRPYIAFDSSGGKFNNTIYTGGAVFAYEASGMLHPILGVFSSDDGGRSFSTKGFLLPSPGGEEMHRLSDWLVTSDGKLVIPFAALKNTTPPDKEAPTTGHLWLAISEDGGQTFLPTAQGPSYSEGQGFKRMVSTGEPRATLDRREGPYKDRIYITWADYDGKKYVIKEAYSKDLGKTWSIPVIVNDNTNEGSPSNPAIAVNTDGTVAVIFNDRRDDPKSSCFQLYLAVSLDGGETFLPNVRASDKPTCPAAPGNWAAGIEAEGGPYPFAAHSEQTKPYISLASDFPAAANGGDTQGLVADASGAFDVAWINGETGVMQLWSKTFSVDKTLLGSASSKSTKDLSHDLKLDVSEPVVDFQNHLITFKVSLENITSTPIEGPFTVVLDDNSESIFRDLHVVHADNNLGGKGAMWNFTTERHKTLEPKQESDAREFHWAFSGLLDEPDDFLTLFAHFRILGPVQQ